MLSARSHRGSCIVLPQSCRESARLEVEVEQKDDADP